MHAMDEIWGDMFREDPMLALTDGQHRDHHHRDDRHGRELQSGRPRSSDIAAYSGQRDPFSFMGSMMSNMHNMMGNSFRQMVYSITIMLLPSVLWVPSVLWRCWLGDRKGIRPVKTDWWGAGVVICLERGADLFIVQLMPLPLTVFCFSKIQIGLPIWYRLTRVVPEKGG